MGLLSLALRNVTRNRRRTAMAVVAVGVGVAALVSMRAFIAGQQELFLRGLVQGQVGALQVHRAGYVDSIERLPLTLDLEDGPALRQKLRAVRGVTAVAGRITFGAMLSTAGDGKTAALMLTALEPKEERIVCPQRFAWVGTGHVFEDDTAREAWLNADLARSVGLTTAPQPDEAQWPVLLANDRDGLLNGEAVQLTATLLSTLPGDRRMGFVPLGLAQKLLRMEGRVTELAVGVSSYEDVPRVQRELQAALGPGYEVHSWKELLPFLEGLLATMDLTFGFAIVLLLAVVLLGLLNAMLTNVLERQREIGTLLAIGMRRGALVRLFVLEGAVTGALGGLFGVALGAAAVLVMHTRGVSVPIPGSELPAMMFPNLEPAVLAIAFAVAACGAAVATLWPAVRASRLKPIEALSAK